MTDLRKIGYAGVDLHLGGPHTHPSVSPSDHARAAAFAIFGDWEDEVPEATKHIQKAIDAATWDIANERDEAERKWYEKDAEIERLKKEIELMHLVDEQFALRDDRIAELELVVEKCRVALLYANDRVTNTDFVHNNPYREPLNRIAALDKGTT